MFAAPNGRTILPQISYQYEVGTARAFRNNTGGRYLKSLEATGAKIGRSFLPDS